MIGVYIAGRKCPTLARECIMSLRSQLHGEFVACVTIDGKDDQETHRACVRAIENDPRITINWTERIHSCAAKLASIRILELKDADILVGLDLDDRLLPNALTEIHNAHRNGAWVTYGNWIDQNANVCKEFRLLTPELMEHVRDVSWFLTAPNTFRMGIFRRIPESFFRWNDGHGYYETGFDGSVMFGAVDLADVGRTIGIKKAIYFYNRNREESVLRAWPEAHRLKVFDEQRAKPRLERLCEL